MEPVTLNNTQPSINFRPRVEQPNSATAKPAAATENPSVTISDDYESPQQILNQKILAALNNEITATGGEQIENLNPADFTPDKVAETILNFIELGLSRLGNGTAEDKQTLIEQARKGIEKGFSEARDVLSGLGVLEGKIAEDVDQTYSLIMQGLDAL